MAVHVDAVVPVHPLTVSDLDRMVRAGIVDEHDPIELLDGVLVEMSPQGEAHAYAVTELNMLAVPAAAAAGLRVAVHSSIGVGSQISLPEPDLVIVPPTTPDRRASGALLVVEISVTSLALDLGPKATIYATAGIAEYWVLDVKRRQLVVHREPAEGEYRDVRSLREDETATAAALDLSVPIDALL